VYLSFLPVKDPQEALEKIRHHGNEVRYKLGTRIRNQTKSIPVLEFYVDDSNDYVEHMDKIFKEINKDQQSKEEKLIEGSEQSETFFSLKIWELHFIIHVYFTFGDCI